MAVYDLNASYSDVTGGFVAEASKTLESAQARIEHCLNQLADDQLLEPRRVQGHDTCILAAIFHSVCHFEGHAQEIVGMTRQLLGEKYTFPWVPSTPEQQSAG